LGYVPGASTLLFSVFCQMAGLWLSLLPAGPVFCFSLSPCASLVTSGKVKTTQTVIECFTWLSSLSVQVFSMFSVVCGWPAGWAGLWETGRLFVKECATDTVCVQNILQYLYTVCNIHLYALYIVSYLQSITKYQKNYCIIFFYCWLCYLLISSFAYICMSVRLWSLLRLQFLFDFDGLE